MEHVEADATPAEEWLQSLNAACNRLSTQYLSLLKAAAAAGPSTTASSSGMATATATSTGRMGPQDPPPPPLAADVAIRTLQCQLAAENICVAASNILSLIRTVRLSLLLMDQETVSAEESAQVERTRQLTAEALQEAARLEQELRELQAKEMVGE